MLHTLKTIESFVTPVVMISANGLLCLALYNRLAVIVNRVRTINKERFDLFGRLAAMAGQPPASPEVAHLEHRLEVLDELGHQLFDRVRMIRDSLVCLLVTVLLMLGCSLLLGITSLIPNWAWVAPTLFVAGVAVMMLGVLRAIQELSVALSPLRFEHDMLEHLQRENGRDESDGV